MKILIAGLGSIGRRHLRNLVALGESDILLYRSHRSTLPDKELAGFPVETDLAAALTHRPAAVIVSNPTALHLQVAIPAAEAGCHLFLEKPVSHTMEGVDELKEAVRHGGGQVLTGFQFRFHPGLQAVRRLLTEGAIGRPLSVRAHWGEYLPGWHPWEDYRLGYSARADLGGGVVLTLCHPLDYLRWLLGEVAALWAFSGQLGDLELRVEDTAEIGLRFTSSGLGSVHLDFSQRPPAHHLEIIGTQGTIRWDNSDGAVQAYRSASEKWDSYPAPEGFTRNDLFLAQMRHFLAVARGECTPLCTLDDGVRALQLALAVHQSQQRGQLIQFQPG
jgi:predicted dehydrogenase